MCSSGGSRISRRGGRGPRRGSHGPPRWLRFENFACQNERIWTRRGGARAGRAPLDPPMCSHGNLLYIINQYSHGKLLQIYTLLYFKNILYIIIKYYVILYIVLNGQSVIIGVHKRPFPCMYHHNITMSRLEDTIITIHCDSLSYKYAYDVLKWRHFYQ